MDEYAELHSHSNFSFHEGASTIDELVEEGKELGYRALALTDHDNLCGAMEFARAGNYFDIQTIAGSEVTLENGHHLTLLASTAVGYSNLCKLISLSHTQSVRKNPRLKQQLLGQYSEGIIALSGCPKGEIPSLISEGDFPGAISTTKTYMNYFGENNFYLELQQNLVQGDTKRIRGLVDLGSLLSIPTVATNNSHYHVESRSKLQDCLVAIRYRKTLEASHKERRPNSQYFLKHPTQMNYLFREIPDAIRNTINIAGRCEFNLLKEKRYRFPKSHIPPGFTESGYLEHLCLGAAVKRYGRIDCKIQKRLDEELLLIKKHGLAGLFLIYHEIIQMAHQVQIDMGLVERGSTIEDSPPGRGRGSSVSMLVGYLIGISHFDPMQFDLSIVRFLPDELASVPDIDLDFPRNIRTELIERVHQKWGWEYAALTGMFNTYKIKSAVRDIGMVLGLPHHDIESLTRRVQNTHAGNLRNEMAYIPGFEKKAVMPAWKNLLDLSSQIDGFPRNFSQHPGGMIISSTPITDQVPIQQGAISGRYVCQWDKESIEDARMVKIDFLSLGALSQIQETTRLVEQRTGNKCDLSRINFQDRNVYKAISNADTIGVFQIESAAQMQTVIRLKPNSIVDMAHEVGAVRPGIGVNDGVREYIRRRNGDSVIRYDHALERRSLSRTLGVILFQDQVNQIAIDVAGMNSMEADQLRRAFSRRSNRGLVKSYWEKFCSGAIKRGVDYETAQKIFLKFNGQFMFPESHAYAFGITAYQSAWLKYHFPVEFYVGIFNNQPMGFYNLETIKEDAKRHGISVLRPGINRSIDVCTIEGESIRIGLAHVKGLRRAKIEQIIANRETLGHYKSIGDFIERTDLLHAELEKLTYSGALDELSEKSRRSIQWEIGIRYKQRAPNQAMLPFPSEQDNVDLPLPTKLESLGYSYQSIGMHPESHIMQEVRRQVPNATSSKDLALLPNDYKVQVVGIVIRRQRPLAKAVFITLEDEFGHIPLVAWPDTYKKYRLAIKEPLLVAIGTISRREGTLNVVIQHVEVLNNKEVRDIDSLETRDWH